MFKVKIFGLIMFVISCVQERTATQLIMTMILTTKHIYIFMQDDFVYISAHKTKHSAGLFIGAFLKKKTKKRLKQYYYYYFLITIFIRGKCGVDISCKALKHAIAFGKLSKSGSTKYLRTSRAPSHWSHLSWIDRRRNMIKAAFT